MAEYSSASLSGVMVRQSIDLIGPVGAELRRAANSDVGAKPIKAKNSDAEVKQRVRSEALIWRGVAGRRTERRYSARVEHSRVVHSVVLHRLDE